MPRNVTTGKADRHSLSAKAVFEYRLEQHKKPKVRSVRPRKSKKPAKSQDDNLPAEAPSDPGSGLLPSMSLAKTTLDGTSSKGDSPAPVPEQELGTSSALLSVASDTPQISALSFQGHQQPSPKTLLQSDNDTRARLAKMDETLRNFIKEATGWREEIIAPWMKDLEQKPQKSIGS